MIPIKLFADVINLVADIPFSKEVEAQIAWSWAHSRRKRPTLTSRWDIAAIRSLRTPIRKTAEADELYRSELFHEIMQYVENTLNAAEVVCRIKPARSSPDFGTVLNAWARAKLVPLVREMLPVLSHLSTVVKISTENENAAAAAAAAPLPAQATGGASVSAGHQQQVSRSAEFGVYQHLLNRCEKCADDCGDRSLKCDCSAFRCNRCYGLRASDLQGVTGYKCDTCREGHGEWVVVYPKQDFNRCFECMVSLVPSDIQLCCPACRCRFCQRCAALSASECCRKRSSEGMPMSQLSLLCPICAGSETYEEGRAEVCSRLMIRILGREFQKTKSGEITLSQLKQAAGLPHELGDLLYDCFFNGYRVVFASFIRPFLELVVAQLRLNRVPSIDPFHVLYCMGLDPLCTSYFLALVCKAQAEDAVRKGEKLVSDRVTVPLQSERPSTLRIAIYGADAVQNSPTACLAYTVLAYWHTRREAGRLEFFLFADGPIDRTHPPAKDIEVLFSDRLTLFTSRMTAKTKYEKIIEKQPHILWTLTGWTNGHMAEVIAAVGLGPQRVLVLSWMGFAGYMCMRKAVHFTVVGSITRLPRQIQECEEFRERVAVVSCYQPALGHPIHTNNVGPMSRGTFNLPSSPVHFLYVFTGTLNRIVEEIFMLWLRILMRVDHACLLLLRKPSGMRLRIRKWIRKFNDTADRKFDPSRVLWRPFQNKTHFLRLLSAAAENGAGAALDSVEPISNHTTAGEGCACGLPALTHKSDLGFQSCVSRELMTELGLEEQCVAESRAEFEELAVQYALNRAQQIAIHSYLLRTYKQRVEQAKLPKELLLIMEHAHAMFREAGGDLTKLTDFDVKDLAVEGEPLPQRPRFVDSPEYAALAAEEACPDAAKRKELLQNMISKGMSLNMAPHALKIMEAHQKKGLILHSVLGAGAFSIVISCTADRSISPHVHAGTRVALKLSKEEVLEGDITQHSLAREGVNMALLERRLERSVFADIIPAPVFVWTDSRIGRCFWGHAALDGRSMIFLCQELIDESFHDVLKPYGHTWRRAGVIDESFQYMVLQPMFQLAFELQHTAGLAIMDAKPSNMARRSVNGHMAVWDLGNSIVFPRPGESDAYVNTLPAAGAKNSALRAAKCRKLGGSKDTSSGLFLVTNQQAVGFCRWLFENGKTLVTFTGGTHGYADPNTVFKKCIESDLAYAYDIYAFGRSVLKTLSHDPLKMDRNTWNVRARQAAEGGWEGIQQLIQSSVDPSAQITQHVTVERISKLLAGVLHPDPTKRMTAKDAILDKATTLPFFSSQHSLALENGTGVAIAGGGPVESLPVPYRNHPHLKGVTLPPVDLLPQPDMGVGVKLRKKGGLKKGETAGVYGGTFFARADTGGLRRSHPSRFNVSSRGCQHVKTDCFICDASSSAKRPISWFITNSVAGPFMNGREGIGLEINCTLDHNSAWEDGSGDVYYVLTANRDIEEGEWLMWKYNWQSGAGIAIPNVSFFFN